MDILDIITAKSTDSMRVWKRAINLVMDSLSKVFWNATVDELKKGFLYEPESRSYVCLVCGESFESGRVHVLDGVMYEAWKAAERHVIVRHSSMFDVLLGLDKEITGLTDHQKYLLGLFAQGLSDKEIAAQLGGSPSTVRNHRFNFREKEKQAKITLALLEMLREGLKRKDEKFVEFHRTAKMVDERYAITEEEYAKILRVYFKDGPDGTLSEFPTKEKRKLVVLRNLARRFDPNRKYTEKEVNGILQAAYHDHATLRRYLIEYGFMSRNTDCSAYWLNT